jgi:hypothetical protein
MYDNAMAWRALVIAFVVACSSTTTNVQSDATGDGTPHGDGSTVDSLTSMQACAQLATDRCMKLQMCSMSDLVRRFGDLGTCETREALGCQQAQNAPDTAETPAQALACSMAIATGSCAEFLGNTPPTACQPMPGPEAGGCSFSAQCQTTFCALGAFALCGQCRDVPQVGTDCSASGCGPNLLCSAANQCQVPGTLNSPCGHPAPCANGFSCVGATNNQANGRCQTEIATLGGSCDFTHRNRAGCNADQGLTCSLATGKCVNLAHVAAGAACGIVNNVDTACTAGATCQIPTGQKTGKCVAPAADSAACDSAKGPDCFFPARCIPTAPPGTAGTCKLLGSMACF